MNINRTIKDVLYFSLKISLIAISIGVMIVTAYVFIPPQSSDYKYIKINKAIENKVGVGEIIMSNPNVIQYSVHRNSIRAIGNSYILYPYVASIKDMKKEYRIMIFSTSMELLAEIKYDIDAYKEAGDEILSRVRENEGKVYYPSSAIEFKSYSELTGVSEDYFKLDSGNLMEVVIRKDKEEVFKTTKGDFYKYESELSKYDGLYDEVVKLGNLTPNSLIRRYAFSRINECGDYLMSSLVLCSKYRYDFYVSNKALFVDIKDISNKNQFVYDNESSLIQSLVFKVIGLPLNPLGIDSIERFWNKKIRVSSLDRDGNYLHVNSSKNPLTEKIKKESKINAGDSVIVFKDVVAGFENQGLITGVPIAISKCNYVMAIKEREDWVMIDKLVNINFCKIK